MQCLVMMISSKQCMFSYFLYNISVSLTHFLSCTSFDLQLEQLGVDMQQLKEPATTRIFRAWVEDWEEELLRKNDCVAEARLLEKYKNLVFLDPDTKCTFTVESQNLEFRRGRKDGGWKLICEPNDDTQEVEPFDITLENELIGSTPQANGNQVIYQPFV